MTASGWPAWRGHRVQWRLALRITVAALLSYAVAQSCDLPMPLWAVLTAIIVTQVSVGRSLKATLDYVSGTLGGAVYGTAVAILVPHTGEGALIAALALAIGPLAVLAAFKPGMAVAPVTAVIVILLPGMTHGTPLASAFARALEVALGGVIGFGVSFLLFPANAHRLGVEAAAATLDQMAQAFATLVTGLEGGLDVEAQHRIQDHIGEALSRLETIRAEARHERSVLLAAGPDPGPLVRVLLRLRHDLVMIGRVAVAPLPADMRDPLAPVAAAFVGYLRAAGAALPARRLPPPLAPVEAALAGYAGAVAGLRNAGWPPALPADAAERIFTLGFALEQMHRDCRDLSERVTEWAAIT